VFQDSRLLPWRTVAENVRHGLNRVDVGRGEKTDRVTGILAEVGLGGREGAYPGELSGGQAQRTSLARALVAEPSLLLLDEPFGALDALTRAKLQDELQGIVAASGATVVMVTHDVDEAVLLSDRIVMLTNGPAATIGEILTVDLPRPRERLALSEDPHYAHLRAQVLEFLYKRQAHPQAKAA
jgi:nitrate/nitrite transport system ATP-binding protein